jgi:phage I-like protein
MLVAGRPLLSLNAAPADSIALCAALPMADAGAEGGAPPEWVHLLPAGKFSGSDGRAYHVEDAAALVAASLAAMGDFGVIDENHATDLAMPKGGAAPARGWIKALEARATGIFGKVEWTAAGKALLADRAYRFISPVIFHDKAGKVLSIVRASLVNKPNLRELAALNTQLNNQETDMDFLAKLRGSLKLDAAASEDAILAAITASGALALQAALDPIAKMIGLNAGSDGAAVLAGVEQLKKAPDAGGDDVVKALQAELADVGGRLKAMSDGVSKDKALAFVDGAIKEGRVGVKACRDKYIAWHMENPAKTEEQINVLPALGAGNGEIFYPSQGKDGVISLNAEQKNVARLLGVSETDALKTLTAEAA